MADTRSHPVQESFLDEGFILDKKIGVGQPKRIENAKILVANTAMDTDKIKIYGARVRVDSMQKVQSFAHPIVKALQSGKEYFIIFPYRLRPHCVYWRTCNISRQQGGTWLMGLSSHDRIVVQLPGLAPSAFMPKEYNSEHPCTSAEGV